MERYHCGRTLGIIWLLHDCTWHFWHRRLFVFRNIGHADRALPPPDRVWFCNRHSRKQGWGLLVRRRCWCYGGNEEGLIYLMHAMQCACVLMFWVKITWVVCFDGDSREHSMESWKGSRWLIKCIHIINVTLIYQGQTVWYHYEETLSLPRPSSLHQHRCSSYLLETLAMIYPKCYSCYCLWSYRKKPDADV